MSAELSYVVFPLIILKISYSICGSLLETDHYRGIALEVEK